MGRCFYTFKLRDKRKIATEGADFANFTLYLLYTCKTVILFIFILSLENPNSKGREKKVKK